MRIIAFAFACEPNQGSEEGAGWNWSRMLARLGETVVLTRPQYRSSIERALPELEERKNLQFVYIDLPAWIRRWQYGQRGIRLSYLIWQIQALRPARRLQHDQSFDLAWHLTFASAWFGSLAALVGPPFVYGPVGGGPNAPLQLLPSLGMRGALYEMARSFFHLIERCFNPLAYLSMRRAKLILVQDFDTLRRLPSQMQTKAKVFPNAVVDGIGDPSGTNRDETPTALFAGRLLPFKGVCFAIRALAQRPEWRLLICGEGPDERRLRRLAARERVESRTVFLGWLPRLEVLRLLREEADVLVLPSLHEGAPAAVTDALACGVPVICTDRGGPSVLAGDAARILPVVASSRQLVEALAAHMHPTAGQERAAASQRAQQLTIEARSAQLASLISEELRDLQEQPPTTTGNQNLFVHDRSR